MSLESSVASDPFEHAWAPLFGCLFPVGCPEAMRRLKHRHERPVGLECTDDHDRNDRGGGGFSAGVEGGSDDRPGTSLEKKRAIEAGSTVLKALPGTFGHP